MEPEVAREETIYAEIDAGNLCVYNVVPLKEGDNRSGETALRILAKKGAKFLLNKLWELPTEAHDNVTVLKLPEPTISIPREKPLPRKKPPTKWEQFAKKKNIAPKKRDKLVYDEKSQEWKPRYGYRSIKNDKSDWLIEIPDNADPNADYYGKKMEERKEGIAKNEYHRLRNIAVGSKMKVHNLESMEVANKEQVKKSLQTTKVATASMGKFTKTLAKEKPPKKQGKKRKFEVNVPSDIKKEKEKNLEIFANLNKSKPKLDIDEAVQLKMTRRSASNPNSDEPRKKNQKLSSKSKKPSARGGNRGKNFGNKGKQFGNKGKQFGSKGKQFGSKGKQFGNKGRKLQKH